MMLQQFHVCIQVADIHRSQCFYQQLGFAPVAGMQHEDSKVVWRYLRHPNTDVLLELLQYKAVSKTVKFSGQRQTFRGLNHIGFHVENLDQIKTKLETLGSEIAETGSCSGYRFLFARGPDGEYLGFAEFDR
jgi:catechol 2,3-dioxygenase-like lactoylglutathione lyase family enzyme